MRAKELIGKEVIDAGAKIVGNVKDLKLDTKNWEVTGIIVKTGFITKLLIQTGDIDKVGDKIVLKVTMDKIQKT